jgi:endonuclease III
LSSESNFSDKELMTETLAKIFIKQQKYEKAQEAYKILSLKYPEKNALFAIQINKIKRLINKTGVQ